MSDGTSFSILSLGPSLAINMRLSTWTSIKCGRQFVFPRFYMLKLHTLGTLLTGKSGITQVMAEVLRYWQIHHYEYQKNKSEHFALSFVTWCQAAECAWSHMQMNDRKLVIAGSWHRQYHNSQQGSRQWTIIDLVQCCLAWLGSCPSWSVLATDFTLQLRETRERERQRERETEPSLKLKCILSYQSWIICV